MNIREVIITILTIIVVFSIACVVCSLFQEDYMQHYENIYPKNK